MFIKSVVALCIIGAAWGAPQQKTEFWKGTALDSTVEKLKHSCAEQNSFACFQFKAFSFVDSVLHGGYLKVISSSSSITNIFIFVVQ